MFFNKQSNASLCAVDRRRREDDAPRISAIVPQLSELSIYVDEHSTIASPRYVRRVVVQSAPALFIVPCSDEHCADGGHDISSEVIGAIRSKLQTFSGSHVCTGQMGTRDCGRKMWYRGEAVYGKV
ncbi:MAG TPA: hypothetical protein VIV60_24385 [Polyangiaceae bacterium]